MINTFDKDNFHFYCDVLTERDDDLKNVITQFGYPPLWSRVPSFTTLIHIILEQQVSLTSAKAAFLKLESKIGHITPEKAIVNGDLNIEHLNDLPDDVIRTELKKVKGIGDWTVDVFLMMVLHRCDCFAAGDIALIKSIKEVKGLKPLTSKEEIISFTAQWKPYRTIAAYLLWHAYIKKRNIKL